MTAKQTKLLENAKRAVVTVGDGRGFIIDTEPRLVVTAAHCLPNYPDIMVADSDDWTYQSILAPLGAEQRTVWAECKFFDLVTDIAVLGPPDNQELHDHFDAYNDLVECARAIQVVDPPQSAPGWLLGLDGRWGKCRVEHYGEPIAQMTPLWILEATLGIVDGMSGSPVVNDEGNAVGLVSRSHGTLAQPHTEGGPGPRLTHSLPGWLLLRC